MSSFKVEVTVDKDKFLVEVEGYKLDVYDELGKELIPDVLKKSAWLAGIAHEVERRYTRFIKIEKRQWMAHWKYWAHRWLEAKAMKETSDNLKDVVAMLFGDCSIKNKVKYIYAVEGRAFPVGKKFEIWRDFFNDAEIPQFIKDIGRDMYRVELDTPNNMTYDKVIDIDSRMLAIVNSLRTASDGYRGKSFEESKVKL